MPLAPLPDLLNSQGREVILGIRPEFANVADKGTPGCINIDLDLVETLGSEALIHATLYSNPFVIRTGTLGQLDILNGIEGFTVEPKLIRVFDAETGIALPGQEINA